MSMASSSQRPTATIVRPAIYTNENDNAPVFSSPDGHVAENQTGYVVYGHGDGR